MSEPLTPEELTKMFKYKHPPQEWYDEEEDLFG
jgi:hypothetical protein